MRKRSYIAYRMWLLLFIAYSCLATAHSCFCPPETVGKSRDQTIRDDFELSTNVYTAVVFAADCKCLPTNQTTRLDCINYAISYNDVVLESIRKRYMFECLYGFTSTNIFYGFPPCEHVKTEVASSPTVGKIIHSKLLHGILVHL